MQLTCTPARLFSAHRIVVLFEQQAELNGFEHAHSENKNKVNKPNKEEDLFQASDMLNGKTNIK